MKQKLLYLLLIVPVLQGCVVNDQTGQMQPGWLFWVFLGLLLGILFIGVLVNTLRKKRPDDAPTKTELEIEAYEEALNKKAQQESENSENSKESEDSQDSGKK